MSRFPERVRLQHAQSRNNNTPSGKTADVAVIISLGPMTTFAILWATSPHLHWRMLQSKTIPMEDAGTWGSCAPSLSPTVQGICTISWLQEFERQGMISFWLQVHPSLSTDLQTHRNATHTQALLLWFEINECLHSVGKRGEKSCLQCPALGNPKEGSFPF